MTIDEVLVDAAGVDTYASLLIFIVRVTILATAADTVDGQIAGLAVAVEGVDVEDLVHTASIAVRLVAVVDLDGCGFAPVFRVATVVAPVVGSNTHCQEQQERQSVLHAKV